MLQADPLEELSRLLQDDAGYAWYWHCNLACAMYDVGIPAAQANEAASLILKRFFHVSTAERLARLSWPTENKDT